METKFKSKPAELRALPNPEDVARFAAGAEIRAVPAEPPIHQDVQPLQPTSKPQPSEPKAKKVKTVAPWEKHDKSEKPSSGINLRLNNYEFELLRFLAEADQRSMQQIIKRMLIPAAEAAAKQLLD